MPSLSQVLAPICRNIWRSSTLEVLIGFIGGPLSIALVFWLLIIRNAPQSENAERSKKEFAYRVYAMLGYALICLVLIPAKVQEREVKRLAGLGYEQRPNQIGRLMWSILVAAGWVVFYWYQGVDKPDRQTVVVTISTMWAGLTWFMMGHIWLFTTFVPQVHEKQGLAQAVV